MPVLKEAYEKATGVKLVVSFGSSSMLAEQIINGAPMDLFLGADFTYPEKVVAAGLADARKPPFCRTHGTSYLSPPAVANSAAVWGGEAVFAVRSGAVPQISLDGHYPNDPILTVVS